MATPKPVQDAVLGAQNVRNRQLGSAAFSTELLGRTDKLLLHVCRDAEAISLVPAALHDHPQIAPALVFSWGWYADAIEFTDPSWTPYRSQVGKVVLFRECVLRALHNEDPWLVLDRMCDLRHIRMYAEAKCAEPDLGGAHFFYHSSRSTKFIPRERYDRLDPSSCATVLYPMYEVEIIGYLVALIAPIIASVVAYVLSRRPRSAEPSDADQSKLLQDVSGRIKELDQRVNATIEIVTQLLVEIAWREHCIAEEVKNEDGVIDHRRLAQVYLEKYLPALEALRLSRGTDCPRELLNAQNRARSYAERITPHRCNAMTKKGDRCSRLAPRRQDFCWQHTAPERRSRIELAFRAGGWKRPGQ